jgi:hypothetical protein
VSDYICRCSWISSGISGERPKSKSRCPASRSPWTTDPHYLLVHRAAGLPKISSLRIRMVGNAVFKPDFSKVVSLERIMAFGGLPSQKVHSVASAIRISKSFDGLLPLSKNMETTPRSSNSDMPVVVPMSEAALKLELGPRGGPVRLKLPD